MRRTSHFGRWAASVRPTFARDRPGQPAPAVRRTLEFSPIHDLRSSNLTAGRCCARGAGPGGTGARVPTLSPQTRRYKRIALADITHIQSPLRLRGLRYTLAPSYTCFGALEKKHIGCIFSV
ncbi:hypothetical protein EVAR_92601_1 [Eumeta japonica]|uniref:Uncharacterized protein n=1 Tax=Eumeta variegata TaxID=151549 RepID=A0A4C1SXH4_EUMVA|nr:hypothetical protein EVAR_92601_1 [Eumeta japonica]